jgi:hypothetical protein
MYIFFRTAGRPLMTASAHAIRDAKLTSDPLGWNFGSFTLTWDCKEKSLTNAWQKPQGCGKSLGPMGAVREETPPHNPSAQCRW